MRSMTHGHPLYHHKVIFYAFYKALVKLNPLHVIKNPTMFLVWLCALFISFMCADSFINFSEEHSEPIWFILTVIISIWFVVLFANFAEAITEYNSEKLEATIRDFKQDIDVRKIENNIEQKVKISEISLGDFIKIKAGELIPCDGEVLQGIATVDESAITGESANVIRDISHGRNIVVAGTKVISDYIIIKVTGIKGSSFLQQIAKISSSTERKLSSNEDAINIVLFSFSIIYVVLCFMLIYICKFVGINVSLTMMIALLICILPTTASALMSSIAISGVHRLLKRNIIPLSTQSMEIAGDIDVLLLDKTGTVTVGNRVATEIIPAEGIEMSRLIKAIELATFADVTPEGRSIMNFLSKRYSASISNIKNFTEYKFTPFSASTRISGCDSKKLCIRKGAVDAISNILKAIGKELPEIIISLTTEIGLRGETPLVVIENSEVLGVIILKDTLKLGMKARIEKIQSMGIRTILITGDNYFTTKTIATEVGIKEFIHEADPSKKLEKVKELQAQGLVVGVTGDGINDAPALAQADLGYTINSANQITKESANIIDFDDDCTKILELIEISRALLATRGGITTFSIMSDVSKYFAIIPIIAAAYYPQMQALNIMGLSTTFSAISAATIFNSLVIIFLLPIALKGVKYRPVKTSKMVKRLFFIFGIGGLIIPFFAIKVLDIFINWLLGVFV